MVPPATPSPPMSNSCCPLPKSNTCCRPRIDVVIQDQQPPSFAYCGRILNSPVTYPSPLSRFHGKTATTAPTSAPPAIASSHEGTSF
ncbi:uncharacterized protein DS421_3g105850 [Arachis hypogaea]|nr:uncharacterized protein DS421_3g105850 [Arachis hypogaea]